MRKHSLPVREGGIIATRGEPYKAQEESTPAQQEKQNTQTCYTGDVP
ncbi:MAG: hypothetical protein ABIP97_03160 [Chthoniobacterales bacterium]